jgi:hypothetical protein
MARVQEPSELTDKLSDILRRADGPPLPRRSEVATQSDGPSQLNSITSRRLPGHRWPKWTG